MRERTLAVVEEQAPFQNMNVSTGPEIKSDNAGEASEHVMTGEKTEGYEGMKWIKVRKNGDIGTVLAGKRRTKEGGRE
jgi:hypothetical protein